jgi:hypothetical protein
MATSSARRKSQAEGAAAPNHPEVKRDILPIVHVRTSTSDVTANDFFLMSTTLFSDSRPTLPNSNWLLPLISEGHRADVGWVRSICPNHRAGARCT